MLLFRLLTEQGHQMEEEHHLLTQAEHRLLILADHPNPKMQAVRDSEQRKAGIIMRTKRVRINRVSLVRKKEPADKVRRRQTRRIMEIKVAEKEEDMAEAVVAEEAAVENDNLPPIALRTINIKIKKILLNKEDFFLIGL
jgi:hypothetical protein